MYISENLFGLIKLYKNSLWLVSEYDQIFIAHNKKSKLIYSSFMTLSKITQRVLRRKMKKVSKNNRENKKISKNYKLKKRKKK